ncbi:MAG: transporter substrate-binding protein, partial [Paenibacillus sp.]|nr:transporter substrate-binding protein [Paenibacillus sp.]
MNRTWKRLVSLLCAVALTALVSACGKSKGSEPADDQPFVLSKEPVALRFLYSGLSDKELQIYFIDPMQQKYPNIKIEFIKKGTGTQLTDLIAAGEIPDLIMDSNNMLGKNFENNLMFDMAPLIKKHGLDVTRLDPIILDAVRNATDKGVLYSLPYYYTNMALYYNKDIFDKFGVSYPADGMTWDNTIELAKKVTRQDGSKQYLGLHYESIARLSMSRSLDYVDAKTLRAAVNNEEWKRVFDLGNRINAIPGNKPAKVDSGYTDLFLKTQESAMLVLKEMLSDETQLKATRIGRLSGLKNPQVKAQFGADLAYLKGVNLQSIFKSNPAAPPAFTDYSTQARSILQSRYIDFIEG